MTRIDVEAARALLARVEAATEPDRELLEVLCRRLLPHNWWTSGNNLYAYISAQAWLEAAIALAERLCPAKKLEIGIYPACAVATLRWYPDGLRGDACVDAVGEASEAPALAVCAALLRALIARDAQPAEGQMK